MYLYNPFENLEFEPDICFLSGERLTMEHRATVQVFPDWLLGRYHMEQAVISMLYGNKMKYADMKLPVAPRVKKALDSLEQKIKVAFESGYDAVKQLDEQNLFHWMTKILYGVFYQDFLFAIEVAKRDQKPFKLSPLMTQKLKNLHFCLQSLIKPIHFKQFKPWSIHCFKINISKDILNYKDEPQQFNFCWAMNDFGIIACLQDNEEIGKKEKTLWNAFEDKALHPIQFEELYARILYYNYTLRPALDYQIDLTEKGFEFYYEDTNPKYPQKFATWRDDIFAQVLTNAWKPWGIELKDIYHFPNTPRSYVWSEMKNEIIPFEKINLPY